MSELGLVLLLLAGFAQGSFGLGMKKQSPLSWESFWLICLSFLLYGDTQVLIPSWSQY